VEKEEYVRNARHIQDKADREIEHMMHSAMARPWQFGNSAIALAAVRRKALVELVALEPPPTDRADIELHFLRPLSTQADRLAEDAAHIKRDLHLLRFRAVGRIVSGLDDASMSAVDQAWCVAYGLIDATGEANAPTFVDRAKAVGVDTRNQRKPHPLTTRQLASVRRGGSVKQLIVLAIALGLLCGLLGGVSQRSALTGALIGLVGLFVFGLAFAVGFRRFGLRVLRAVEDEPTPRAAVLVASRRGRQWVATVVCEDPDATPLVFQLIAGPPSRWRGQSTLVTVYGQAHPGGFMAVLFPDGALALSYRPARSGTWPPASFRHR
jgi:hypothetical protein